MHDGGAIIESAVQVAPLPPAPFFRGLLQVAAGVGDIVAGQRGHGGRQPCPVRLRPRQAGAVPRSLAESSEMTVAARSAAKTTAALDTNALLRRTNFRTL